MSRRADVTAIRMAGARIGKTASAQVRGSSRTERFSAAPREGPSASASRLSGESTGCCGSRLWAAIAYFPWSDHPAFVANSHCYFRQQVCKCKPVDGAGAQFLNMAVLKVLHGADLQCEIVQQALDAVEGHLPEVSQILG